MTLPDALVFHVEPYLLPKLPVQVGVVRHPAAGDNRYHHQPQITWHGGRFFAMWVDHPYREDMPGQIIECAESGDGLVWSSSDILAPVVELGPECDPALGVRVSGGLWNRNSELFALSARFDRLDYSKTVVWKNVSTEIFSWKDDSDRWIDTGVRIDDFIGFEEPRPLADGGYLATGHDRTVRQIVIIRGGETSIDSWDRNLIPMPADGHFMSEPNWWQDSRGIVHVLIRDESGSQRLYYTKSDDGGKTFPPPMRTEIPDARARVSTGILNDGRLFLCGNSGMRVTPAENQGGEYITMEGFGERVPLTLAVGSDDGKFEKVYSVRGDTTSPRWLSSDINNGYGLAYGYQYPNVCEHDGFLYVIHSVNKEDIMVARVSVADL